MDDTAALLAGLEAGEPAAWSALAERYRPFVRGRLRAAARARNWFWLGELDDATQEVLLRFFEAVRDGRFRYRDEARLRGFLVRTAFYVAMAQKDSALLERPAADLLDRGDLATAVDAFDPVSFAETAFDTLGRRQCLAELYAAIEALPDARAEVLRLTLLGLKPREIAPLLGRSAGAVSVLKFNALEALREALEGTDFLSNCGRYFLAAGEGHG